jgi:hypothetical protein
MDFELYKPIGEDDVFMGKTFDLGSFVTITGSDISWYYVTRGTEDYGTLDMRNLYHSFDLISNGTNQNVVQISDIYGDPEGGDMIVGTFDRDLIGGSYIDGSTVVVNIPTGTTSDDKITYYGAAWNGEKMSYNNREYFLTNDKLANKSQVGGNAIYLFRGTPYTGYVNGEINVNAGVSEWSPLPTGYPHLKATPNGDDGRDVPEGILFLSRGIVVLFDNMNQSSTRTINSVFSANTMWTARTQNFSASTYTGGSGEQNTNGSNREKISFIGSNAVDTCNLTFRPITEDYKILYFCHAGVKEFNDTTNETYDHMKQFTNYQTDPVYLTELALYDDENDDQPIAYVKLSEPMEKDAAETLTFKVELDIE